MKTFLLAIIATLLLATTCGAQTASELLEMGKTSLKEAHDKHGNRRDFDTSIYYLEQAVKLNPKDPEVHYLLGNAYNYSGSPDASYIPDIDLAFMMKASNEMETTIRLSPKYTGEIMVLDPYNKITAIWGSVALSYLTQGKHDSATWAFTEGKRRGGFSELSLAYHRAILDNCAQNGIIFISGDEPSMTKWYLQEIEHYRTDVTPVNTSMLQLPWYSEYVYKNAPTLFSSQLVASDTTPYRPSNRDTTFKIPIKNTGKTFKWKPEKGGFISRSNDLFEDIIIHNSFNRRMYYEMTFPAELMMGLDEYKRNNFLVNEISTKKNDTSTKAFFAFANTFSFDMVHKANTNIDYDITDLNCLRYIIAYDVSWLEKMGRVKEAKALFRKLVKAIPAEKYPYNDEQFEKYMTTHDNWLVD